MTLVRKLQLVWQRTINQSAYVLQAQREILSSNVLVRKYNNHCTNYDLFPINIIISNCKKFTLKITKLISGVSLPPTDGVKPECRQDSECPSELACINVRCQDPCALNNMCGIDQQCRVLDTLPLRTMVCQCPPDTVTDSNGNCKRISKSIWTYD